jgi:hypothetical protein
LIDFDPTAFAETWISSWNNRDVEGVLAHFDDDAVFSSPIAFRLGHGERGRVQGKASIRRYWKAALALNPGLRFNLESVHVGTDCLVIAFTTQDGLRRSEVLVFDGGLAIAGYGTVPATAFPATMKPENHNS